jgi:hypothetical protein
MAEKSIGRRMYENVMGTPEQNAAAEKRMEERDKKNPDSLPAKINKAAKAVTGKNSEPEEEVLYGRPIDEATGKQTGKSRPIGTVKQTTETITTPKFVGSTLKKKSEPQEETFVGSTLKKKSEPQETNYKKGGMTASSRADGIAQRGKTRGKIC